jgi:3'(2'), 5'-bisphosphate nucleotidase
MYERELEAAARLARKAGEAVMQFYSTEVVSVTKIGADNRSEPVTAADIEASRIIVEGLSMAFPGDGILSEEETDQKRDRLSRDRVWVIDPIDGTQGFIKKDGDFAVQIGLAERGEAVAGVVYLPAWDTLYYASRGHGAFSCEKGGEPIRLKVSEATNLPAMNIAVSRDHRSPKMTRIVEELGLRGEIGRGSVGIKIGMIAEQTCDLYIHLSPRTKFWDTCAPQVILEEAGGKLTDLFGNEIRYDIGNVVNLNGVFASNGAAHEIVLQKLIPVLSDLGRYRLSSAAQT